MKDFEIRRNDDGSIDEVVARSEDGTLRFHIEQMDKDVWSFGLSGNDPHKEYHLFNLLRRKKRILIQHYDSSDQR